ncbi:SDR family NAD(P)-dependent oxidoreductase [Streptacidiphilus sp. 4-A2]|nr:SDR family NAD(P)-dependent oxidoreductase [Streptacidiphilus sp. 4-A2]
MADTKVALITGSTSGIGRATALRLAAEGYDIAAVARRTARLEALREEISARPQQCLPVTCDLSEAGAAGRMTEEVLAHFGRLDVVVASAGHGRGYGPLGEAEQGHWPSALAVNLSSVMDLAGAALQPLRESSGTLVLIGSVFGIDPAPDYAAYAAAKHGLRGFVRSIRREQNMEGVRVCLLNPGTTNTEFASVLRGDTEPMVHDPAVWGFEPLLPEDVAAAVAWVAGQPAHVDVEEITIRATRDR